MDDRNRMDPRAHAPWMPWAFTAVALVLVAIVAYGIGVQQQQAAGGVPARQMWFFGFPGFWFFILFWMFIGPLRRMFWYGCGGGPWRGHRYRPWRYGYYDDYPDHPYGPHADERAEWEA